MINEIESLSAKIRALADKHGVWEDVQRKLEREKWDRLYWSEFFRVHGPNALANSAQLNAALMYENQALWGQPFNQRLTFARHQDPNSWMS